MTGFAHHFREHVAPLLKREVATQATSVATGHASYTDAYTSVMDVARRHGAVHLPDRMREGGRTVRPLLDLEDWIATALLDAIADAERVAETQAVDPVTHYERLAATCRDPHRMRWVFAAICPEYRAHLLAEWNLGR